MRRRLPLLPLLLLALAACQTTASTESLYKRMMADLTADDGRDALSAAVRERQEERYERVVLWHTEGELATATDYLWGAGILVRSDQDDHLILAQAMGQAAAERGDARGNAFAAEATDRLLMLQGLPQRFGTQIVWEPVLREWRLYHVDPRTTDEERAELGVPPLAELESYVEIQNQSAFTKMLRGE